MILVVSSFGLFFIGAVVGGFSLQGNYCLQLCITVDEMDHFVKILTMNLSNEMFFRDLES